MTEKVLMLPKESYLNQNESKRVTKKGRNFELGTNNDLEVKANKVI